MSAVTPVWELRNIVKRYPGVTANDRISLKLMPGQIHGLLGQNGCGKSTLIKILSGVEQPTAGEILKEGLRVRLATPTDARRAGIATVFQEFSLVPDLSVAENLFLGRAPTNSVGLIDWKAIGGECTRTLSELGLGEIKPHATLGSLSIAQQQLVEIAKAVSIRSSTLILDEPTAALSQKQIDRLHALLRHLKSRGCAILYVSHRLDEVVSLIDVATVLKDGQRVRAPGEVTIAVEPIITAMLGEAPRAHMRLGTHASNKPLLEAHGLANRAGLEEVSFVLHAGEILGIAGVMGSGRTSLMRILFGLEPCSAGSMRLSGEDYAPASAAEAIDRGVGFIPENRKSDGLFFNFDGSANATIAALHKITRRGFLSFSAERTAFCDLMGPLAIAPRAAEMTVARLSGGNQQKIILARWTFTNAEVLLLDEPIQGVDVGAKAAIYRHLRALTEQGKAIVLVSSDLEELLMMSDRVGILRSGVLRDIRTAGDFDEHSLSMAIAGPPRHVSGAGAAASAGDRA
jgi:ABC-type sugar transport system ATPase subunit